MRVYNKSTKDAIIRELLEGKGTQAEIAARHGVPIGSVSAWLFQYRKRHGLKAARGGDRAVARARNAVHRSREAVSHAKETTVSALNQIQKLTEHNAHLERALGRMTAKLINAGLL